MAIPILPILGTLSGVASTAWDTYAKIKRAKETALGKAGQDAVVDRVGKLEDACLEQAPRPVADPDAGVFALGARRG